nr:hypothetical protein [Tanacetum cinerariifolium]
MEVDEDDDPNEIAEIFKIDDNLFDYETPLCKAFNEFNNLFKIDTDLFTFYIQGIRTYEEYELNNTMMRDLEEPWLDNAVNAHEVAPFTSWENYGQGPYANAKTKRAYNPYLDINRIFGRNYEADNAGYTQDNHKHKKEHHDPSACRVRRFEMIKYPFDAEDEYVSI